MSKRGEEARDPNDVRSDVHNPNNDANMDTWADANNPNNPAYVGKED